MEMFYILLALALLLDLINGIIDSANIVATVIASRAMRPRTALAIAALAEFCGPFIFGVAVAKTVGADLLHSSSLELTVVIAAMISAIAWNLLTWRLGIPSSSSHALLGGLLGAAILSQGFAVVKLGGLYLILLALFLSPPLGMLAGYLLIKIVLFAVKGASPKVNTFFRKTQYLTLIGLGLSHGSNDAQKTMGVITLGLVSCGMLDTFTVPLWVVFASATAIALGTLIGGWKLIRTLGGRIYRIRPIHAFSSQIAGSGVILGAALLGGPVSTTHVISSSIVGVGAGDRINRVRWNILSEMMMAWLLTIPATALLSAGIFLLIRNIA